MKLPPDDQSLHHYVKNTWEVILKNWENGYSLEQDLQNMINYIEERRDGLNADKFDCRELDWEEDYVRAIDYHEKKLDYVENRRAYVEDVAKFWREHFTYLTEQSSKILVEAFKAIVLLNGAALIAAISFVSGQISNPEFHVQLAAKMILIFCFVSLVFACIGFSLLHSISHGISNEYKGRTFRPYVHAKIESIGDEVERYLSARGLFVNFFIYGSIILFGLGLGMALSIVVFF
ncbi:hypothetical protein [Roseibium sp.]|uniref:hypothetical protein n=1 Tax=Roseibium sp. TaxID=1936156 RepID=UPI00326422BD